MIVIVGVLAALGVAGDLLARMARNYAAASTAVLALAVVAATGVAFTALVPDKPDWLMKVRRPLLPACVGVLGLSIDLGFGATATPTPNRSTPAPTG